MAIVHTFGASSNGQEFTNNKRLLLAAVDKTMGKNLDSMTANKTNEYNRTRDMRQSGDPLNDPDDTERGFNARSTLDTLRQKAFQTDENAYVRMKAAEALRTVKP